jgi:hypothetical protein
MKKNSINVKIDFALFDMPDLGERQVSVEFYYTPEEPRSFEFEGRPEEVEVIKVIDKDLGDVVTILPQDAEKVIEELVLKELHKDNYEPPY